MRELNHDLKQLVLRNRDGGAATQKLRARELSLIADQLHEPGDGTMRATSFKAAHAQALLEDSRKGDPRRGWDPVSSGTLKNRLATLRWWARKVYKSNVVANRDAADGIAVREHSPTEDTALWVIRADLSKIANRLVRISLKAQRVFGLSREDPVKFSPHYANRVDHLVLKGSWTKDDKARPDLSGVLVRNREYIARELESAVDRDDIVSAAVEQTVTLCADRRDGARRCHHPPHGPGARSRLPRRGGDHRKDGVQRDARADARGEAVLMTDLIERLNGLELYLDAVDEAIDGIATLREENAKNITEVLRLHAVLAAERDDPTEHVKRMKAICDRASRAPKADDVRPTKHADTASVAA